MKVILRFLGGFEYSGKPALQVIHESLFVFCKSLLDFFPGCGAVLIIDTHHVMNYLIDLALVFLGDFDANLLKDGTHVPEVTCHPNHSQEGA